MQALHCWLPDVRGMVEKTATSRLNTVLFKLLIEPEAPPQKGMDSIAMGYGALSSQMNFIDYQGPDALAARRFTKSLHATKQTTLLARDGRLSSRNNQPTLLLRMLNGQSSR
jgi:hypothetical protein